MAPDDPPPDDAALAPDPNTLGMDLGEPDPAPAALEPAVSYQVLARKYRPRRFEDLIGQEAMVRTLSNAFKSGRIAHAFMLTGVRGVGKTTTARLLARGLNYMREGADQPSVDLDPPGEHCDAITQSRHVDVMEMDAASRTGVGDIREILDSVRYAPVSARYKVYVIDEVHMLSTSAFNALLKTLEEPPPHAKFIFATTEIRKVPVTVLSRCQRFDLKRVERDVLTAHLARICGLEGAQVSEAGLALIARAAEGSVRDALSILDQAIVQADPGAEVSAGDIRDMLGLADRARTLDLFEFAAQGDAASAIIELGEQYARGGDPAVVFRDLLDHCHETTRARILGATADLSDYADEAPRLRALGAALGPANLSRLWQMLLKAHQEVRAAPDPLAAGEMALIRIAAAAGLPPPEDAARLLKAEDSAPSAAASGAARADPAPDRSQPQHAAGAAPALEDLAAVARLAGERRDLALKSDIERFVRPVRLEPGKLVFEPAAGAPKDLAKRLAARLLDWTGQTWAVLADDDAAGGATLREERDRAEANARAELLAEPLVKAVFAAFPNAKILSVSDPAAEAAAVRGLDPEPEPEDDNAPRREQERAR
ncbi:MAG: DNA polymerase III subunit gamma/tau [Maricaulaceae bacterium]